MTIMRSETPSGNVDVRPTSGTHHHQEVVPSEATIQPTVNTVNTVVSSLSSSAPLPRRIPPPWRFRPVEQPRQPRSAPNRSTNQIGAIHVHRPNDVSETEGHSDGYRRRDPWMGPLNNFMVNQCRNVCPA